MEAPTLHGERLVLRAISANDLDELHRILLTPEVSRWWRPSDRPSLVRWLAEGDTIRWAVTVDDRVAGKIQAYEHLDSEYRHAGIDLFLDPVYHGQGLGAEAILTVVAWLVGERGHHRLVIDPARANERAIRCYERVGFRRVGVMREYWYDHVEKRWADGVLLDLLAEELRTASDA